MSLPREIYQTLVEFVRTFGAFILFFLELLRHTPMTLKRRFGLVVA